MDLQVGTIVKRKLDGKQMSVVKCPWATIDGMIHPDKVECRFYDAQSRMQHGVYNLNEIEVL